MTDFQHPAQRTAVIGNIQPVTDLFAVTVDRQRLFIQRVDNHQRNQLLGKLEGTVIVGTIGNQRRQTESPVISIHQMVARRLASARTSDCGAAVRVPIEPGARYRLSGWIRTEDLEPRPRTPGAMMNMHGGRGVTKGVRGTSDWTEVSTELDAGSADHAIIHCLFGGYGGARGTAWWDDVALVKIGGGATLAGALETLANAPADASASAAPKQREHEPDAEIHARGAVVYGSTCIACHGIDGKGVPGAFPPLDGSDWITGDPELPIKIVLRGLMGPIQVGDQKINSVMAGLPQLTDQQIADVLTYVRQRWRNDAAAVAPATVKAVRAATASHPQPWTAAELGR